MSNTQHIDLENINILSDAVPAYDQIVTEVVSKVNNNNIKLDANIGTNKSDILKLQTNISELAINVKSLGIKGDGIIDDTNAFQSAMDFASLNKKTLVIPNNCTILVSKTLWLPNGLKMRGEGESSVINFINGSIFMSDKDAKRPYTATTNYIYDYAPVESSDYVDIVLTAQANKGTNIITVNNTTGVSVGDTIHIFNNDLTLWSVLSDSSQVEKWNNPETYPLGQIEIEKVIAKTDTTITFDKFLLFNMPIGSTVRKNLGNKNVHLYNFKMVFTSGANKGCRFEHINNSRFENLIFEHGGIHLMNKCYDNQILNCIFKAYSNNAVSIYNYSTRNIVSGNSIEFGTGVDAAIIVCMGNANIITNNMIHGTTATPDADNGGINIHARSYGNVVSGNTVVNCIPSYSLYFGAFNNIINNNISISSGNHFHAYYAFKNKISNNIAYGKSRSPYYHRGIYLYYSDYMDVTANQLTLGIECSSSKEFNVSDNKISLDISTASNMAIWVKPSVPMSSFVIKNNIINNPYGLGIKIERTELDIWNTIGHSTINNNTIKTSANGIHLKNTGYIEIKNNLIECGSGATAIYLELENLCMDITNNKIVGGTYGIDFSNFNSARHSRIKDNIFQEVTTPIYRWTAPSFNLACGNYGFEIYDISTMPSTRKWVYNSVTSGLIGSEYWTVKTI